MNLEAVAGTFLNWCRVVADVLLSAVGGLKEPRRIRLVETERDCFRAEVVRAGKAESAFADTVRIADGKLDGALPANLHSTLRGGRIELILHPDRFLFRPL